MKNKINRIYNRIFVHPCQITLMILLISSASLFAQKNINQIFRGYKNDPGVQAFRFNDASFKKWLASEKELKSYIDDAEIIMMGKDIDITSKDKEAISLLLKKGPYELITEVRENKTYARLYLQEKDSFINHIYAEFLRDDTKIYFIFSGKIWPAELQDLGLKFEPGQLDEIMNPLKK